MKFPVSIFLFFLVVASCHQQATQQKLSEEASANKEYYESMRRSDNFYNYPDNKTKRTPINEKFFKKSSVLSCAGKAKVVYSRLNFYFCKDSVVNDLLDADIETILFLCRKYEFEAVEQTTRKRIKDIYYHHIENDSTYSRTFTYGYNNSSIRVAQIF